MDSAVGLNKQELLRSNMPDGNELVQAGLDLGNSFEMGVSAFCRNHNVSSELEYKLNMAVAGRTMTAATIGLQDWPDTLAALRHIYKEGQERGFYVDRFILALDRRMGLPADMRAGAIKETGPLLANDEEWLEVAQAVDIQPHMGDMMIGSPASVENAVHALKAGVNYIGNLSQFAWKYQGWPGDDVDQMAEVVKAIGVMASKAKQGAVVHSYLDDGFPAQFGDYSSYIGWAKFERYVVETLIGANLGHAYGGLSYRPTMKMAVTMAMESLRPAEICSSFYYTNTTRYTPNLDKNYAILSVDALHLMIVDRYLKAGSAIMPVPVTEAIRIPSAAEILEAQTIAHEVAKFVPEVYETINWEQLFAQRDQLIEQGNRFYDNIMNGLESAGIDITDPLQMIVAVRRLGPRGVEREFGVGTPTEDPAFDGYEPVVPTDVLQDFLAEREKLRSKSRPTDWTLNRSHKAFIGSSDVHELGMRLVIDTVENLGIKPVVGTVGIDPDEVAEIAQNEEATVLLISTHNGMALSYAEKLMVELKARNLSPQVIIGGRLNQDVKGEDMPVDVTEELKKLGIDVCNDLADLASIIQN
jgi:methylmalonyl-CoA mutase cobalamin-binding subunit